MVHFKSKYKASGIKHVEWYGQNVCTYYGPITRYLQTQNLYDVASIFSVPQELESASADQLSMVWTSSEIPAEAKNILELSIDEQIAALKILDEKLNKVSVCASALLADEKFESVKLGQLLNKAILYPDHSFVFYSEGKIIITAWGFINVIEDNKKVLILSKVLKSKNDKLNTGQPIPEDQLAVDESNDLVSQDDHGISSKEEADQGDDKSSIRELPQDNLGQTDPIEKTTPKVEYHSPGSDKIEKEEYPKKRSNNNRDYSIWVKYFLFFLLILLIAYILYYILSNSSPENVAPDPSIESGRIEFPFEKIKEIDPGKINPGPGSDSIYNIVNDRLNLAIIGQNKNLDTLYKFLNTNYDTTKFMIIYKNNISNRVQIEGDFTYLSYINDSLKSKRSQEKILSWYERIFTNSKTMNDPFFKDKKKSWYFDEIQAFDAWDITTGDTSIVIAVLDSGFDLNHEEIKDKIYKPYDVSKLSPLMTYTNDLAKHGTHVASLCAGSANNNAGVSGIAPGCKLMPIKVGDDYGRIASSYIIDGVLYALNNGADVINISLGALMPGINALPLQVQEQLANSSAVDEGLFWNELFKIAEEKNIIIVLAAGNNHVLAKLDPMKRSRNAIIVGASTEQSEMAEFSNFGNMVTVSAPGKHIFSAIGGNSYESHDGTSMAAPIVAGACALMKSVKPTIKTSEILDLLSKHGKVCNTKGFQMGPILQINNVLKNIK
jgi:serine protease